MNFFINNKMGNIIATAITHGFFYVIMKLFYELGLYKKIFYEIFGVASYTGVINYSSVIGNTFKVNEFSMRLWLDLFVYRYSMIVLIFSFIFSLIFVLMYSSRKSGENITPTWNIMAIILLAICIIGGISYTPIIKSVGLLFWSYLNYIFAGFLPFYISTFILCGTTAFKSYELKKRFN